jgi:lysophospholipase L1-like esterase
MNINPQAKRILCFGDSNTWGHIPNPGKSDRYPSNVRWTGLLQQLLGNSYEIIEEGLGARLINQEDPREGFEGKNGMAYLLPCLDSHRPLDLVVLMLGTTGMKEMMKLNAEQIAGQMREMVEFILKRDWVGPQNKSPQILLMSPPHIKEEIEFAATMYKGATEKSKELGALYEKVAKELGIEFLDTSKIVTPSDEDGIHLDEGEHTKLAEAIKNKVLQIFNE